MIIKHKDEFGYYWFDILDEKGERRLNNTFRYIDPEVARREAIALERICLNNKKNKKKRL
jgi:hypothetical protein